MLSRETNNNKCYLVIFTSTLQASDGNVAELLMATFMSAGCTSATIHQLHMTNNWLTDIYIIKRSAPFPFGRICFTGHAKRRGEQLKWSVAFSLYIGSFSGPAHTARLGRVCFLCI